MTAPSARADVDLDGSWTVLGKLHGGYLLATVVGAVVAHADSAIHPHPVSASATYVTAPDPGYATIEVFALKAGRMFANYRAVLRQHNRECVQVLVTMGRLPEPGTASPWRAPATEATAIQPLEDCVVPPVPRGTDRVPGVLNHIEMRFEPGSTSWAADTPSGNADIRGWLRMITDWDPVLAQFILADAPPPPTFNLGMFGWVPTLTLQVLLRQLPSDGWHLVRQHALLLQGGLFDQDCTIWTPDAVLVTQARQLAAYRD